MTTSRALKIVARKYADAHGVGYQKALQVLFDPIQSVIAQNPIPHIWVEGSEFSPFEWYRGMTRAESVSPVGENFIVTSMSPIEVLGKRGDLLFRADLANIWQLRQAERAGTLSKAAVEYKESLGVDPRSVTPIVLHVRTIHTEATENDSSIATYYGRDAGVYEFNMVNEPDPYLKGAMTKLSHVQAVEWVGKLMQTDQLSLFFDGVTESKRVIAEG